MLLSPLVRSIFSEKLIHRTKHFINRDFRKETLEELRLQSLPRYTKGRTLFNELDLHFTDVASFCYSKKEIFEDQIYAFPSSSKSPRIIDCGANIGLSTIFFALKYPHAEIISFEPDPTTFEILQLNINQINNSNIQLIHKAAWIAEDRILFNPDGADGGKISHCKNENANSVEVDATDLSIFLKEPVDMLKMDIEGSEKTVIPHCNDLLRNVKNLFIEYHGSYKDHDSLLNILNILRKTGFIFRLRELSVEKKPFYMLEEGLEKTVQYNIFAYQIRELNNNPSSTTL